MSPHIVDLQGAKFSTINENTPAGARRVIHLVAGHVAGGRGEVKYTMLCRNTYAIEIYPGEPPICVSCTELAAEMRKKNTSEIYG